MDNSGLQLLIEANHRENQQRFKEMKDMYVEQRMLCKTQLRELEKKVSGNAKFIDRVKTTGTLLAFLWTVVLGWIKLGR